MTVLHLGAFVCCRLPFLSPGCETGLKGEPVGEAQPDQKSPGPAPCTDGDLLAARTLRRSNAELMPDVEQQEKRFLKRAKGCGFQPQSWSPRVPPLVGTGHHEAVSKLLKGTLWSRFEQTNVSLPPLLPAKVEFSCV